MLKFYGRPASLALIILFIASLCISGCTIRSGPKGFDKPETAPSRPAPDAPSRLNGAFLKTAAEGKRFLFSGWSLTKIQKRNIGLYVAGGYDQEKGYNIDGGRIFGQPFRYYRLGNDVYISEGQKWRKINPAESPLEPFVDFAKLGFLSEKAVQLPDDEVLGKKCDVYHIVLDAQDAVRAARSMGLDVSGYEKSPARPYFDRLDMKLTLWVGKADSFIYQYKTKTTMPVPGAGSLYQEVFFKFWNYNSSSINLQSKEKLEQYLVQD